MLITKEQALKPFEEQLNEPVPVDIIKELQERGYQKSRNRQKVKDVLSWAYNKYAVVIEKNGETGALKVKSYNDKLKDINLMEKKANTQLETLFLAIRDLVAIQQLSDYDDYFFPDSSKKLY